MSKLTKNQKLAAEKIEAGKAYFGVSWLLVVFIRKISGKNAKYIVG